MPAGYRTNGGRAASLLEVIDPKVATKPHAELSHAEKVKLVVKRFQTKAYAIKMRMLWCARAGSTIVEPSAR